ncbi:hypothetical protein IC582_026466 [Cucumis melo]
MMPNQQLVNKGELCKDPKGYRRLVGKLNYSTVTRPNIAYFVDVVSQFIFSPSMDHWVAVEQILCYLKVAPGRGILYKDHRHRRVECFSDADWAWISIGREIDFWILCLCRQTWYHGRERNKMLFLVRELSQNKAMTQSVCKIVWIQQLLSEIGFSITVPAKLWFDNQAAVHERTKHIEVDCHFIREKIQEKLVSTGYVKTKEQLRDILTKAINGARLSYLCNKLDMINIFAPG